ncbi:H-type small acid-soluble spore protein [Alkalibacillus haloalkaliphilus]|uniref:Small, acid-soluble spore protein H n=1 Tax=Alkalibacillus haloalkaliphilus TaxID=94136 RepID=A0A511W0G4_9BACI|nr:H-type small acid-soluble spore protein [Alkalibacillus haloalkaliphilus]MDV2581507.1 H-type small acid-soluble spore protein [Alkalibacillus haloalkaliphilus]GEN44584.1 small, acid-soluble spore protein H [Alkalibacillus haloalkaliphilus]
MDRLRAEQIAESPEMKNVQYNGQNVYIQHVNDNGTAHCYFLDEPENEFDAQLSNLREKI